MIYRRTGIRARTRNGEHVGVYVSGKRSIRTSPRFFRRYRKSGCAHVHRIPSIAAAKEKEDGKKKKEIVSPALNDHRLGSRPCGNYFREKKKTARSPRRDIVNNVARDKILRLNITRQDRSIVIITDEPPFFALLHSRCKSNRSGQPSPVALHLSPPGPLFFQRVYYFFPLAATIVLVARTGDSEVRSPLPRPQVAWYSYRSPLHAPVALYRPCLARAGIALPYRARPAGL